MIANVYSTLSGKLAGKHPTLGILVREDGMVQTLKQGKRWSNPEFQWSKGSLDSQGYLYVRIRGKNYWVHRLVAETFLPNPENKPTVDHYINRDTTDNRVCNLRWADQQEQCRNTKSYDGALDLGVRKHDDPKEWDRRYKRYARANGLVKKLTPEQYERKKAQARERYKKKKAEQSAQPSV